MVVVLSLETLARHVVEPVVRHAAPLIRHCMPVTVDAPRQESACYAWFLGLLRRSQAVAGASGASGASGARVVVLCHGWLDVPTHPVALALYRDLSDALAARAPRRTDAHALVYLQSSLHESFEAQMADPHAPEPFHRLAEARTRLESLMAAGDVGAEVVARHMVRCPPFMEDNPHDTLRVARAIADIATHYASRCPDAAGAAT